jgi:hypothetical protein
MTYAYPAWQFAADTNLLTSQRLQNKVLRTTGNFPRLTPVRELHKAFNIPYIYNSVQILNLSRQVKSLSSKRPKSKLYRALYKTVFLL